MEELTYECYLSYRCNQRCLFCFVSDGERRKFSRLSFGALARNIYKMAQSGCSSISFLGGEPTIHPEVVKICSFARKVGYKRIFAFSNGQKFGDAAFTRAIVGAGLTNVNISVHSFRAEVHDSITRSTGSFDRTLRGLDNLRAAGIRPNLICVVTALNAQELPELCEFYVSRGISDFTLFFTKHQGRMLEERGGAGKVALSMTEAATAVKKAFRFFAGHRLAPPALEHFVPCVLKGFESFMTDYYPQGVLAAHSGYCIHPAGHNEDRLGVSYKGRKHLDSCGKCVYSAGCPGIDDGYLARYGGAEFVPVARKVRKPAGF